MKTFLERVVEAKRVEVAHKRCIRPEGELEHRSSLRPVRDFRRAISGPEAIIAEIKRRSPSVPAFRQSAPTEHLAAVYEANGASAISIVTDWQNFGSSLADVARARGVSALPVLVKDFIFDRYQVVEARAAGADAVLLIARILSADELASLLELAHGLGMAALVECHDEDDVGKAVASGAGVIGVNNRDLSTFEVSLETTRELTPKIPRDAIRVAESGIRCRRDVEALAAMGVNAFLVGGVLLDSEDPGAKLRELAGSEAPPMGETGGTA